MHGNMYAYITRNTVHSRTLGFRLSSERGFMGSPISSWPPHTPSLPPSTLHNDPIFHAIVTRALMSCARALGLTAILTCSRDICVVYRSV